MQAQRTLKPMLGIALFAVFSTIVLLLASFANTGEKVSLTSDVSKLAPGDITTIQINLTAGDDEINGIEGAVEYDMTKLEFVNFTPSVTPWKISTTEDISNGRIEFRAIDFDSKFTGADLPIGVLKLKALASEGVANVTISSETSVSKVEDGSLVKVNGGSLPITIEVESGTTTGGESATTGTTTSGSTTTGATTGTTTGGEDSTTGSSSSGTTTGATTSGSTTTGTTTGGTGGVPTGVSMYFSQQGTVSAVGENAKVDLMLNAGSDKYIGIEAGVTYDTSKLELVLVEANGDVLGGAVEKSEVAGKIEVIGLTFDDSKVATGDNLRLATLTFKVKSAGGTISVDSGASIAKLDDGSLVNPSLAPITIGIDGGSTSGATSGATSGVTSGATSGATSGTTSGATSGSSAAASGSDGNTTTTTTTTTTTGGSGGSGGVVVKPILSLSPSSSKTTIGSSASLDIYLDTKGESMIGADMRLSYDASKISFGSFVSGSSLAFTVDKGAGTLRLAAIATSGTGVNGSKVKLGTLKFKGKAKGSASVKFSSAEFSRLSNGSVTQGILGGTATISVAGATGDKTKPTAPGALSASASSYSKVTLRWSASKDSSGIQNYFIYRKTGNGKFVKKYTILGNKTSYNDVNVISKTKYSYYVKSIDKSSAHNISTNSATATITTPGKPATTTPAPAPVRPVTPSTPITPIENEDSPTPDEVENTEEPEEVYGTSDDTSPTEEMIGKTTPGEVNYKTTQVEVTNTDVRKVFIRYGLYAEGLFDRTEEVEWDGKDGSLQVELPNLVPGTRYYYQVVGADADGKELRGEVHEIFTLGYSVSATLTDADGNALPELEVTLFSDPINGITDSSGVVVFENVAPGSHTIDFNYDGEQVSLPVTVEDTIISDDGTAPDGQSFTLAAELSSSVVEAVEGGGNGLVVFIIILLVLIAIVIVIFIFIRRQQQPAHSGNTPSYDYASNSPVLTPGPSTAPPQDLNDVVGQNQQYPSPGSVYDPNQPPK